MKVCIECNTVLDESNTYELGFRLSLGLWYLRFNRLCDMCSPKFPFIKIRRDVK